MVSGGDHPADDGAEAVEAHFSVGLAEGSGGPPGRSLDQHLRIGDVTRLSSERQPQQSWGSHIAVANVARIEGDGGGVNRLLLRRRQPAAVEADQHR